MRVNTCWRPKQLCDYVLRIAESVLCDMKNNLKHKMVPSKTLQTLSDCRDTAFVAVLKIYQKKFSRILVLIRSVRLGRHC